MIGSGLMGVLTPGVPTALRMPQMDA